MPLSAIRRRRWPKCRPSLDATVRLLWYNPDTGEEIALRRGPGEMLYGDRSGRRFTNPNPHPGPTSASTAATLPGGFTQ